jgi:hypothetical protein
VEILRSWIFFMYCGDHGDGGNMMMVQRKGQRKQPGCDWSTLTESL